MDLTRNPALIFQELHDAAHPDSPLDQAWVDRMVAYCNASPTVHVPVPPNSPPTRTMPPWF